MRARLQWRKADIAIGKAGVQAIEKAGAATVVLDEADIELPDLLTDLQDRTQLTRRTITRILTGSGRLNDFKRNPQQYIELSSESINRCKRMALADGIKYQRLGADRNATRSLRHQNLFGVLRRLWETDPRTPELPCIPRRGSVMPLRHNRRHCLVEQV